MDPLFTNSFKLVTSHKCCKDGSVILLDPSVHQLIGGVISTDNDNDYDNDEDGVFHFLWDGSEVPHVLSDPVCST